VTVIKSLIIPKFVYLASLLPTPKNIIKELNQLLFKFLWKGVDKTIRLSVIKEYEKSGLKMIDIETMIKSLRLAWLKRIFNVNDAAWKGCIRHQLKRFGGLFVFHCNYNIKDHPIPSQIYAEMLQWGGRVSRPVFHRKVLAEHNMEQQRCPHKQCTCIL